MRRILGVVLLLGCAAQPKAGRPSGARQPYKDAPVLVGVATGAVGATEVAAAVVVTVAVGTVVVGAEQFPDPPAGTPPTETAPKDPPSLCRSCRCWGKGRGPGFPPLREVPDGNGVADHTRATCQEACREDKYSGFDCSGDKGKITWFN
jgi:hypothetical protein